MFYVTIIKIDSQAINRYETINAAQAAFHTEMAYAYAADVTTTCIISDAKGNQLKIDSYEKFAPPEIEIPEQVDEPEEMTE